MTFTPSRQVLDDIYSKSPSTRWHLLQVAKYLMTFTLSRQVLDDIYFKSPSTRWYLLQVAQY